MQALESLLFICPDEEVHGKFFGLEGGQSSIWFSVLDRFSLFLHPCLPEEVFLPLGKWKQSCARLPRYGNDSSELTGNPAYTLKSTQRPSRRTLFPHGRAPKNSPQLLPTFRSLTEAAREGAPQL